MADGKKARDKYKELHDEVSRMASLANKRIKRLEKNELTDTPAYQSWEKNGSIRFSVRGKNYNELQSEYFRLKRFIEDKTSLVRGAIDNLKEIAKNTGIKYNRVSELKASAKNFFALTSKVQEYLNAVNRSAEALGYQRIWTAVNTAVAREKINLAGLTDVESQVQKVLSELDKVVQVEKNKEGFPVANEYDFIDL